MNVAFVKDGRSEGEPRRGVLGQSAAAKWAKLAVVLKVPIPIDSE